MKYNTTMTVKQLTEAAEALGLKVTRKMKKADIIDLLEKADTAAAADQETPVAVQLAAEETKTTDAEPVKKLTVAEMLLDRLAVGGLANEYDYTVNAKGHVLLKLEGSKETVARIRGTKNGAYVFPGRTLKKVWEEMGVVMEYHKGWANEWCVFCSTPEELFKVLV